MPPYSSAPLRDGLNASLSPLPNRLNEISSSEKLEDLEAAKEGIKADFDGIVTEINVTEGSTIGKGTTLFTLKSTNDIVIKSSVNKYDIVNVEEGQPASVTIKNKEYAGKVSRIERMTKESGTGTGIYRSCPAA